MPARPVVRVQPPDKVRGRHRQASATTKPNTDRVSLPGDLGPSSAFIVTTVIAGGRTRRRVFLTRTGARRAVERDQEAGRPSSFSRVRLTAPRVTGDRDGPRDGHWSDSDRSNAALRVAWLRVHAGLLYEVDPGGQLSAQLFDLADLLEVLDQRGGLG